MCAVNLLLFFTILSSDLFLFGIVGQYIDAVWIWGWNLGTVYFGWQLLKARFRLQRAQGGSMLRIDRSYRAPLLLMMPGLLSDGWALVDITTAYVRDQRYLRRRRASSLWVGQPDKNGVIKVQAVRITSTDSEQR